MEQQNLPPTSNADLLPTSTLAIVSLVSAILGFTLAPVIGTIVALITGYMARSETRSIPTRASGDGLATAGIIMGWIQVALLVIGVCCAIAYLVFMVGIFASSGN
jgi:TRAP-type C4-dicarboxylate transport system permease small subunit